MNIKFDNISTVDFAKVIGQKPGMFLGNQITLSKLECILMGFDLNSKLESLPPFEYFNYWIKYKLDKFDSTYNWKTAILENCNHEEKLAFDRFYILLDEFLSLKPQSIITTFLTEDNFAFYYNKSNLNKSYRIVGVDNIHVLSPAPYQIKLIEFDYGVHSYHYDYYYLVGESSKGKYYRLFDSLIESKKDYHNSFGQLKWQSLDNREIENEFKMIIQNTHNS